MQKIRTFCTSCNLLYNVLIIFFPLLLYKPVEQCTDLKSRIFSDLLRCTVLHTYFNYKQSV